MNDVINLETPPVTKIKGFRKKFLQKNSEISGTYMERSVKYTLQLCNMLHKKDLPGFHSVLDLAGKE